jgi:hypothetical protein
MDKRERDREGSRRSRSVYGQEIERERERGVF